MGEVVMRLIVSVRQGISSGDLGHEINVSE